MAASTPVCEAFDGIAALAQAVRAREVSAVEVTRSCLERIAQLDDQLGCFLRVDEAGALRQAEAVDAKIREGADEELLLAGVPVGIKDMLCTGSHPADHGSVEDPRRLCASLRRDGGGQAARGGCGRPRQAQHG